MKIQIGAGRELTLKRDEHGEWRGQGHGLRFRVTRSRGTAGSFQWRCRVWHTTGGPAIASCTFHRLKPAIQEGARLADLELDRRKAPTVKHEFHCDCNECEWFRAEHGS